MEDGSSFCATILILTMFCGKSSNNPQPYPQAIIDVEQVLKDYVWSCFKNDNAWYRRLCVWRSSCRVEVPMDYFEFETLLHKQETKLKNQPDPNLSETGKSKHRVEIATDFVNNTASNQIYKFRLEKTRRAKLFVTVQKGFTIGGKFRIVIGLPKLLSDSNLEVQTDMSTSVSKTDGEEVEETVVLETTSDITVTERSKCVAKLAMDETPVSCDFTTVSRMNIPRGGFNGAIVRKRDNKVLYSCGFYATDTSLKSIFKDFIESKTAEIVHLGKDKIDNIDRFAVDIKSQGIIEGVRLCNQSITLQSENLQSDVAVQTNNDASAEDGNATSSPSTPVTVNTISSSTVPRPRSINGPIIEESNEDDDTESESGSNSRVSNGTRALFSGKTIRLSVQNSPSSTISSPGSDKASSAGSDAGKTMTTV